MQGAPNGDHSVSDGLGAGAQREWFGKSARVMRCRVRRGRGTVRTPKVLDRVPFLARGGREGREWLRMLCRFAGITAVRCDKDGLGSSWQRCP